MRWLMPSILFLFLSLPALGFELQQKKSRSSRQSPTTQDKPAKQGVELAAAIMQVRGFADRAQSFEEIDVKVEAMTHFADLLWRYDENYARQLFLNAFEAVGREMSAARGGIEPPAGKRRLRREELIGVRTRVLARFARHDSATAKRWAKIDSDADQTAMNLFTALELVKGGADIPVAVDFANLGLRGPIVPRADLTVTFLNRLRQADPQAADKLFMTVLDRFTSLPELGCNDLLTLGYYVFTYPGNQPSADTSIRFDRVGSVGTVNIGANRRGVSLDMVRLYLEASANVLSRPVREVARKQEYYVAAYQLLQKAQTFAPNLVPRLSAVMQVMLSDVPSSLMDAASDARFSERAARQSDARYDLDAVLSDIEKKPDSESRDLSYLTVAFGLYEKGEFERGRKVAERISDLDLQRKTTRLMNFGIGARAIKAGETSTAIEEVPGLGRGIESAELLLAIAEDRFKEGNGVQGAVDARTAAKLSSDIDASQRPYLVLAAAGKLAKLDPSAGLSMLGEAVALFNSAEETDPQWSVTLGIRGTTFDFELQGLDSENIAPAIKQLASSNREVVIAAILSLKKEKILGRSLMLLGSEILK